MYRKKYLAILIVNFLVEFFLAIEHLNKHSILVSTFKFLI